MIVDDLRCLQSMPVFADVPPAKLKLFALASTKLTFDIGHPLTIQGDAASAVYVIISGEADVRRETGDVVVRLASVGTGAIVGDFGIYLDQPYSATVVPVEPVTALQLDRKDFMDIVTQEPQFLLGIIRQMARMVIKGGDRYASAVQS